MMRLSHGGVIVVSGLVWFVIGLFLLFKGINLFVMTLFFPDVSVSFLGVADRFVPKREYAVFAFALLAGIVGFLKGRFVLAKTVHRVVARILSFSSPVLLRKAYSGKYLLLLGSMCLLGVLLKWAPLPMDVRGFLDVAVGSALINGAILYFQKAIALRTYL